MLETFDSNYRIINDIEDFNNVFVYFARPVNATLRTIICDIIEKGGYTSVNSSDSHPFDPEEGRWDGLLTIHFATPPSTQETVKLIKAARADDFGMEDDKTLYLWWD